MPHNFFVSAFTNTLHYQKRKKDKVTKNANDVSVTFFALLEILMKSVLPHHAHINKKMNDNNNNILRSRSAAEEKKPYTSSVIHQAPPNFKYLENESSVSYIYIYIQMFCASSIVLYVVTDRICTQSQFWVLIVPQREMGLKR